MKLEKPDLLDYPSAGGDPRDAQLWRILGGLALFAAVLWAFFFRLGVASW